MSGAISFSQAGASALVDDEDRATVYFVIGREHLMFLAADARSMGEMLIRTADQADAILARLMPRTDVPSEARS